MDALKDLLKVNLQLVSRFDHSSGFRFKIHDLVIESRALLPLGHQLTVVLRKFFFTCCLTKLFSLIRFVCSDLHRIEGGKDWSGGFQCVQELWMGS